MSLLYKPMSKFQTASVDVTIRTPKDVSFQKVSDFILYWYGDKLKDVEVIHIYQRKDIKAFTFRLSADSRNAKEDLKRVVDYLKDNAPLRGWII